MSFRAALNVKMVGENVKKGKSSAANGEKEMICE